MSENNDQIRLAARPSGLPRASDWDLTTEPVPVPARGELVVAVEYFSIDPAMRRWIAPSPFGEPVGIGDVMEASAIGRVTASEHHGFAVGEYLYGSFGVQEFACSDGTGVTKLDPSLAPLTAYLGALGIPGLTAYFGMLELGRPTDAETVVVSGAAGGVGSVAGQIARINGSRTIGIAGGPEKCRWIIDDLGFHAAIDYTAEDVASRLSNSPRTESTSSSTTSAARSSTRCSPGRPAEPEWSSAAGSPSTTCTRHADHPTTCS
jgi:NADPH-dependent curcumin reductase